MTKWHLIKASAVSAKVADAYRRQRDRATAATGPEFRQRHRLGQIQKRKIMDRKLTDLLDKLGDNFIGLWRFRVYGTRGLWCVTLHHNGYYYDTYGKATPELALAEAIRIRDRATRKQRV